VLAWLPLLNNIVVFHIKHKVELLDEELNLNLVGRGEMLAAFDYSKSKETHDFILKRRGEEIEESIHVLVYLRRFLHFLKIIEYFILNPLV